MSIIKDKYTVSQTNVILNITSLVLGKQERAETL